MIYKLSVRTRPEYRLPDAPLASTLGLDQLEILRDYYLETVEPISPAQVEKLRAALGDPLVETVEFAAPLDPSCMVQVAHRRGIVDNENDSLVDLCRLLGIPARAGKVTLTYVSPHPNLLKAVKIYLYNPAIEEIHTREPDYETLQPIGFYLPVQTYDLRNLSAADLASLGKANGRNLNARQMRILREIQIATKAAHVTDVLLEAADARWSDHCFHTTWRSLGNLLSALIRSSEQTGNPNILSMFHDNAGVWRFYEGYGIALKAETHNGPSAVSAYFGQLTKLGGVLRDILGTGLGADPFGVFEYTATGPLDAPAPIVGWPAPRQIARETIRAVKEYGNTFGVPMMAARMAFHPKYRAKPFALGGCIGLVPESAASRGQPRPGDLVMLLGGLTGNDGIHGASASSAGSSMDVTSVQIGSPLEQVKFRQAILDLREAGCLRALTDVGGAGLNSAVGEMGENCGVWLNTARVPLKTSGLPMWRILLSESQERMVLALLPEKWAEARALLDRHCVRHAVIGRFTNTRRYTVVYDPRLTEDEIACLNPAQPPLSGEIGFDVPYEMLRYQPEPQPIEPLPTPPVQPSQWPLLRTEDLPGLLERMVADPELCDQSYAGSQYDSTVQGHTRYGPYTGEHHKVPTSYWAGTPLPDKSCAVVFSTSFNPWLFEAHPVWALRQCFLGLLGTQVLAGVRRADICLCDNFYTPHREEGANAWLVGMVHELGSLVVQFGTPVLSGKDSSAGSTQTDEGLISVPPAVYLSGLGKIPDVHHLLRNDWQAPGHLLVRLGPDCRSLAGTVAARTLGLSANDADALDLTGYRLYLDALAGLPRGLLASGVPIGPGGVLGQVFLGTLASGFGIDLEIPAKGVHELLQEHRCGALVEVAADRIHELPAILEPRVVGRLTMQGPVITLSGTNILSDRAIEIWRTAFEGGLR
jgi:phosphoribosylformylglycinamidine synthase